MDLTALLRKFKNNIKALNGSDKKTLKFLYQEIKAGNYNFAKYKIDRVLDTFQRDMVGPELIEIVRREGK